jgi:hypothetical protein
MIDFTDTRYIESALFVKWTIPDFETVYISDYHTDVTIAGNVYTNTGTLMSVGEITSELRASASELAITLSGIPTGSVSNILTYDIKGSAISIYRGFFNPTTHVLLDTAPLDNPALKFKGVITNYSIADDVDVVKGIAITTISLSCNSMVEVLSNKVTGRRTNLVDFPGESSMNRVLALSKSNFQFGAPKQ